jgi:hypothetical protein
VASPAARAALPDGVFAPYEVVRELGARPAGAYVVRQPAAPGGKPQLMVAELFAGLAKGPDGKESAFVREARRIGTVTSPNLARVRDVVLRGEDAVVYSELLDGEKLAALWGTGGLPLEIALRVIVDVLSGVAALHSLRDARQQPMKLAHGELSPATVAIGLDGVARVLHAIARRVPGAHPDPASIGYMAPEVHAGEGYDQRADVFGVGVLLWEVLSGGRLFTETTPEAIAARVRSGPVPPPKVPDKAPWAKGLVDVVTRALAASADDRWPTATAMAAEVRKAAGLKLAPASTAAAFAKSAIAERSKARRQQLETMPALVPAQAPAAVPVTVPVPVPVPAAERRPPSFPVHVEPQRPAPPLPIERDIPIAPGIPMPAQEVEELGSDALADAPESIPPRPAGGFVLDPFAAATKLAQPQPQAPPLALPAPPLPAPILVEPFVEAEVPPLSGAPAFAAGLATPVEVAVEAPARPPAVPAKEASPPPPARDSIVTDASIQRQADASRRRKVMVLGSVGALGALILVLALARVALRDRTTHEVQVPAPSAAQVAPPAAPPTVSASPPPPDSMPVNPPPSGPPAAVQPSASPAPAPPPPPAAPTPPAPPPVAARPPPPAMHPQTPPPPPRPKKKPAFDPNSL